MIAIRSIASSSAGNCYVLDEGSSKLLLECGVAFSEIKEAIDFRFSDVDGCVLSHEHRDHSRSAKEVMKAGIDLFASRGTLDALNLSGHRAIPVSPKQTFRIGAWTVAAFETQHDASESLGFLIGTDTGDKLAFITDSYFLKYRFTGLTHLMIECNFSEEILDQNMAAGRLHFGMRSRLYQSHFSLENVKDFLRANDLSSLREVHLIHLSNTNSNSKLFKREIAAIAGCPVYVSGSEEESTWDTSSVFESWRSTSNLSARANANGSQPAAE